jgi:hypothetical protein
MGSGAKSYMRKGFLIYEEMHRYFQHKWGGRYSYMTLHPIPLNFVIFEENLSICSDKCEIVHVFMFEVIFDRYIYAKNLRVLPQKNTTKRSFLKSFLVIKQQ